MDDNLYKALQAMPTMERPANATSPLEAAFWVILLLSPALFITSVFVYWWLVAGANGRPIRENKIC